VADDSVVVLCPAHASLGLGRLLLAASICCACNAGGLDPKANEGDPPANVSPPDFAWDGVTTRPYRDAASGLRFAVPVTGYRVTSTRFDPNSPPIKMKNELTIEQDAREVVRIDVWHDSERLGLTAWFDKYLRFMTTPDAAVEAARAGRAHVDAIVVVHPRSPQALAQRSVVFDLQGRIVRVTSLDDDDPRTRAVFERVLDALDAEGSP